MPETKTKNWVDFRHVRENVDFGEVLEAYGVTLRLRGPDQHHGFCPLPGHTGEGRSPSFSAHLGKRAFHCFGCGSKGNTIDFVARMEGLNPDHPRDIRKAALLIQERFLRDEPGPLPKTSSLSRGCSMSGATADRPPQSAAPAATSRSRPNRRHQPPPRREEPKNDSSPEESQEGTAAEPQPDHRPRVINAPLDFELKGLDPNHPYLQKRGISAETIRTFGLGYCSRGLMSGRIAIPLRNTEGYLIGYAGRVVDDALVDEKNPKYRLPGSREKEGTVYEFSSGAFLFNANRIEAPAEDLIVVEGFFSVFHLHQLGWTNVVALMGSACSPEQASLIRRSTHFDARVWIMTDGDAAGVRCAENMLAMLAPDRFVRWVSLEQGEQPHTCSEDRLHELLDLPVRF
ncbi:toprim domain-containing protein [Candidatus Sumerlaeota bacterium]|nr:toprim domain-containing protein [Candidatus Sumerlaeota bacterium]